MKTRIFLAFLSFAATVPQAVVADSCTQVLELPMQGYAGHFREHCMDLQNGQTLRLAVHSPYPVRVNVHHHADGNTVFLLDEVIESPGRKAVGILSDGEYCLEVRNPGNRPSAFDIRLEYQVFSD